MSEPTRAELLLRLNDPSDAAAWHEFVTIYEPFLLQLTRQWGLQEADARDLLQEVFLGVAHSIRRFEHRGYAGGFRGWLAQIARHKFADHLSRRSAQPNSAGGTDAWEFFNQLADDDRQTSLWNLELRRELFQWAARCVRSQTQAANWLAFYQSAVQGDPVSVVAERLGMHEGMVYVARSRVLARIRKQVETWLKESGPDAEIPTDEVNGL